MAEPMHIACLVNHVDGVCPGYPHTTEEKNMNKYPYVSASSITLTEEVETMYNESTLLIEQATFWKASLNGASYDHDGTFVSANGPRVEMQRSGDTAAEAYSRLVEALEAQGWTVK